MTKMRSKYTSGMLIAAALLGVGLSRTVVSAQGGKTAWDGVFTADQAAKGKETATAACGSCHGPTLTGGDLAPTLSGKDFIDHWYDAKLSELATRVRNTMPADAPNSLKPEEYANVVAYMLQMAGYPAGGTALAWDEKAMDDIKLTKSK